MTNKMRDTLLWSIRFILGHLNEIDMSANDSAELRDIIWNIDELIKQFDHSGREAGE